jgi:hypothetical protein
MEHKTAWDDIPSLEGLDVDWDYEPDSPLGKRADVRLSGEDIDRLFAGSRVAVVVATSRATWSGQLLDLSVGGIGVSLPEMLAIDQPVKVGFFLGRVKIVAKAIARHCRPSGKKFTVGLMFVALDEPYAEQIRQLYVSKMFRYHLGES